MYFYKTTIVEADNYDSSLFQPYFTYTDLIGYYDEAIWPEDPVFNYLTIQECTGTDFDFYHKDQSDSNHVMALLEAEGTCADCWFFLDEANTEIKI